MGRSICIARSAHRIGRLECLTPTNRNHHVPKPHPNQLHRTGVGIGQISKDAVELPIVDRNSSPAARAPGGEPQKERERPFDHEAVSTPFAVRACQAGFNREEIIHHHQVHGEDVALTFQHSPPQEAQITGTNDEDVVNFLQTAFCRTPDFLKDFETHHFLVRPRTVSVAVLLMNF